MSNPTEIRIVLADDHALLREGLANMLETEPGFSVVGQAGNGEEAAELAASLKPDVLLMDVKMPQMDGLAATRHIKAAHPSQHILLFTMFDNDQYLFDAISAGVDGYLLKDVSRESLCDSIRRISNGECLLDSCLTRRLFEEFSVLRVRAASAPPPHGLSAREVEVLRLVAEGLNNREIGGRLFVEEKTVKTHLHNIFDKIGVRDRTQAALYALQNSL
ncbi:MAG TPA: response regulator transcription factor [Armatimonadota bacterium]